MNELVSTLMEKAKLDESVAEKVVEVLKDYLEGKLPKAIEGPVMGVLDGVDVGDVNNVLGQVKGFFK